MKNTLLLLITIIFTNLCHASFPLFDTLKVKQDTIQTETAEQYHIRMQKMGFDISNCNCRLCGDGVINNTSKDSNVPSMYVLAGILLMIVVIWLVVLMFNMYSCVDNRSNCDKTPNNLKSFSWMSLVSAAGICIAIRALMIKLKNNLYFSLIIFYNFVQ